ncbi:cytochrome c family protein [Echinicola salinicaeni]|uniref:diheme cytochrome c-553 n=1 Tax=Echinicola salinicaeni TaxID=2762757 RepID=UPI001644BD2B|nr:diheme cytochrome c-553 [Echinicola salinicaeni]
MKKYFNPLLSALIIILLFQCSEKNSGSIANDVLMGEVPLYHGFESQIKFGEHLVLVGGCNDCHTPKKMTVHGPVLDSALWLSGHPAEMPKIKVDRAEMEAKGLAVTGDLTEWIGPWGVSYAANLTPDETGIGTWKVEQLFKVFREGKYKGLDGSRMILPPMPWEMFKYYTDEEVEAIFAYLKSIKPISNQVPPPLPPLSAVN